MVIPLITLLTYCVNTKTVEKTYFPELVFPIFPELKECERTENGVIVPNEFITSLAEYKIWIEETEKNYNEMKELYDEHKR